MAQREKDRVETAGGRALRAYLRAHGNMSVPDFCEKHGIDRIRVQKAMNGGIRRVAVDLACAIEKATGGAVRVSLWAKNELRAPRAP
jgi:hypothetical protein